MRIGARPDDVEGPHVSERKPEDYWRADHDALRVSFIGADGEVIREAGSRDFPAPLNCNSRTPMQVRLELVHEDGCSQVLNEYPVRCYR